MVGDATTYSEMVRAFVIVCIATLSTRSMGQHLCARSDPLADFLFVTKRGYCEYFASAMAVLLRAQGVPSRVVTGFQSGYFNDVSNTWVVRASDAHAWVEAWMEGRGWVTYDPTPQATEDARGGWLDRRLQRINMYLDAADMAWQQWVLAYNPGQYMALAFAFRDTPRAARNGEAAFSSSAQYCRGRLALVVVPAGDDCEWRARGEIRTRIVAPVDCRKPNAKADAEDSERRRFCE